MGWKEVCIPLIINSSHMETVKVKQEEEENTRIIEKAVYEKLNKNFQRWPN